MLMMNILQWNEKGKKRDNADFFEGESKKISSTGQEDLQHKQDHPLLVHGIIITFITCILIFLSEWLVKYVWRILVEEKKFYPITSQ